MSTSLIAIASLLSIMDPEGVVTTAPAGQQAVLVGATAPTAAEVPPVSAQAITPHGLTTSEQIDRWVSARASEEKPFAQDADPWAMRDDRTVHGEVSAAIGTGDYTAYSASVSLPIGEKGRLDLSYRESKNDPWAYGYGYGRGYGGYGYGYGDYGYRPGRSQSVGVHFESDSSRSSRPAGDVVSGRPGPWRDAPRDPTALLVIED